MPVRKITNKKLVKPKPARATVSKSPSPQKIPKRKLTSKEPVSYQRRSVSASLDLNLSMTRKESNKSFATVGSKDFDEFSRNESSGRKL